MGHTSNPQLARADDSLASRRLAKGYSLEDLAIATGLTTHEIVSAENGGGPANYVQRIESVLR
ncbi:hypothetical protein SAMN03159496_05495 [Rhizobium sp. NFR07]|uniref:hypothetical protein n=1 Tax=Rhizobium sp. NFR07 TaxID=1566262 RepID=UPI0008E57B69|nr:hypothetical protein [Rhizobium sp. NFR07]SFB59242.1 hypothetical protein SAMN03159496_05495 [Rhizobium sp. NFR07]